MGPDARYFIRRKLIIWAISRHEIVSVSQLDQDMRVLSGPESRDPANCDPPTARSFIGREQRVGVPQDLIGINMTRVIEGDLIATTASITIVVARFNELVVDSLLKGALDALKAAAGCRTAMSQSSRCQVHLSYRWQQKSCRTRRV